LVQQGVEDRREIVEGLFGDEESLATAYRLSSTIESPVILQILGARARLSPTVEHRRDAIAALGRQRSPEALAALAPLATDPDVTDTVMVALAQAPQDDAVNTLVSLGAQENLAVPALRALLYRSVSRGDGRRECLRLAEKLGAKPGNPGRGLGLFAEMVLEQKAILPVLASREVQDRRWAALAALFQRGKSDGGRGLAPRLLAASLEEPDRTTQIVLRAWLLDGDPEGIVPLRSLRDCVEEGGPDKPACLLALAARATEGIPPEVHGALSSPEPWLRTHAALGLGRSSFPGATLALENAYRHEVDAQVRWSLVSALADRHKVQGSPTLPPNFWAMVAALDPAPPVRQVARQILAGHAPSAPVPWERAEWFRLQFSKAVDPLRGTAPILGFWWNGQGQALPLFFDDQGHAILGGLWPGSGRLVLAPRLRSYDSSPP
jgi:hypothetical protein